MLDVKDRSWGGCSKHTIQDYIEELQNEVTALKNQLAELKEKPSIVINYATPNYIGAGEVTCDPTLRYLDEQITKIVLGNKLCLI